MIGRMNAPPLLRGDASGEHHESHRAAARHAEAKTRAAVRVDGRPVVLSLAHVLRRHPAGEADDVLNLVITTLPPLGDEEKINCGGVLAMIA